ncbi:MAG: hypothetical protein F6J94_04715 [Moorea sp. SIO1F2]|nr:MULTISPECIES: hypothetical protein [unclassified Moorena]NEP26534.1 hypothetical protein [Moorena sp. SIO3I6]NET81279.1 hypothetical protein [Moorena sp. SIO1F2]
MAKRPRYANGHALRSRSVGFAETLPERSVRRCAIASIVGLNFVLMLA